MADASQEERLIQNPENAKPPPPPNSRGVRFCILLLFLLFLAMLAMIIYLMTKTSDFEASGETETLFSNSSRIVIVDTTNGTGDGSTPPTDDNIITLADVHGYFGFANYTCDNAGPVQVVQSALPADAIGVKETWFKVILRNTIQTTDPNVVSLDPDDFTITLAETGSYFVSTFVLASFPRNFTGSVTACTFFDISSTGLFDILGRTAMHCNDIVFEGNESFGPMTLLDASDMFSISTPSKGVLRFLLVTESETQLVISAARVKLTKI